MNKKIIIVLILLIIFIVILGSLTGIPVLSRIEDSGCVANYKKYLFPRTLCQLVTHGHCATTDFNEYNAEIEIVHCLCDKYLDKPDTEIENKILQKCNLVTPDCNSAIERIKIDYCNKAGLNSVECDEYFRDKNTQDVSFICQNKTQIFYKTFIH